MTEHENGITNALEIAELRSGAPHIICSNNDEHIRCLDAGAGFACSRDFVLPWAVNATVHQPRGRLLLSVGDDVEPLLFDPDAGPARPAVRLVPGHVDFSFAAAWHPGGNLLATGNQDCTTRVYDIRSPNTCLAVLKSTMGAVRSLRFSGCGSFLAAAEPADYVTLFDIASGCAPLQGLGVRARPCGKGARPRAIIGGMLRGRIVPTEFLIGILIDVLLTNNLFFSLKQPPSPDHLYDTGSARRRSSISLASWRASLLPRAATRSTSRWPTSTTPPSSSSSAADAITCTGALFPSFLLRILRVGPGFCSLILERPTAGLVCCLSFAILVIIHRCSINRCHATNAVAQGSEGGTSEGEPIGRSQSPPRGSIHLVDCHVQKVANLKVAALEGLDVVRTHPGAMHGADLWCQRGVLRSEANCFW